MVYFHVYAQNGECQLKGLIFHIYVWIIKKITYSFILLDSPYYCWKWWITMLTLVKSKPPSAALYCSYIKGAVSIFWFCYWCICHIFFSKLMSHSKSSHSVFHSLILRFLSLLMCLSAAAQQTWTSMCACSPERRTLSAALRLVTPHGPKPHKLCAAWHMRAMDASSGRLRLVRRGCWMTVWMMEFFKEDEFDVLKRSLV